MERPGPDFEKINVPNAEPRVPAGATFERVQGKNYRTLELPEEVQAINWNEYQLPSGISIEVDEKGVPKDEIVRNWMTHKEFKGKLI